MAARGLYSPVQCRTTDIVQWKHGKFLASRHTCYISSEVAVHSPNRRRTCPLLAVACDHCSTAPWGSSPPSAIGEWVRIQGPWVLLNFWDFRLDPRRFWSRLVTINCKCSALLGQVAKKQQQVRIMSFMVHDLPTKIVQFS